MAETTLPAALEVEQWDADLFEEYNRDELFTPYMGTSEGDLIHVQEDLATQAGKTINVPLVVNLSADGVTGDNMLRENEEQMNLYNDAIVVDQIRNAVLLKRMTEQATPIDLRKAGRGRLKVWLMNKKRDLIISRFYSPHLDGKTAYASAAEADKDAWVAANTDRLLFGSALSNNNSNDHSASLLNVDGTSDDLDPAIVSLLKRIAKTASPHIRPIKVKGGREWYVIFAGSLPFRDLKSNMAQIHREAGPREGDRMSSDNPLYTDGDLVYDGVIIREVPEIGVISGVGAGGIDVAPVFLCGAQALGYAYAQKVKTVIDDTIDYGNQYGIAIGEIRSCKKLMFNNKQHGMVTGYVSAVADS